MKKTHSNFVYVLTSSETAPVQYGRGTVRKCTQDNELLRRSRHVANGSSTRHNSAPRRSLSPDHRLTTVARPRFRPQNCETSDTFSGGNREKSEAPRGLKKEKAAAPSRRDIRRRFPRATARTSLDVYCTLRLRWKAHQLHPCNLAENQQGS